MGERETVRHEWVEVKYRDMEYRKQKQKFSGFTAQIIQHEIDHCNGILIWRMADKYGNTMYSGVDGKNKKLCWDWGFGSITKNGWKIGSITDFFAWHANLHPFDQQHSGYTDSNKIPGFKSIRNSIILPHNVSQAPAFIIAARAATYKNFVNEIKHAVATTFLAYDATENFVRQYINEPMHFTRTGTKQQLGLHKEMPKRSNGHRRIMCTNVVMT